MCVSLRPDQASYSCIKLGNIIQLLVVRQRLWNSRKKGKPTPLIIHILHYECSFLNLKNKLYNFCRKSNEHCPLIKPKGHGTCGFTFHHESGLAHRNPSRESVQEGQKAGLEPRASLLYCCGNLSLACTHFLVTWRPGELILIGVSRSSFSI